MQVKDGIALTSFKKEVGDDDIFRGFNLENREEGEEQFNLDREEILEATILFIKRRFDPFLKNPILTWLRDSLEHRLWPPARSDALSDWGVEPLTNFCGHIKGLGCMQNFDLKEALEQYSRLKKNLRENSNFGMPFREFWEYVSRHFSDKLEYFMVLIPIRVSLLILADTSCNERGISEYNRIHTASRPNLEVSKVRNLFAIKHYGPQSAGAFDAEELYERWQQIITESNGGAQTNAKRRNLGALLRKIMQTAQSKHCDSGMPKAGSS